jgi:rod shape-determining protein MreC
MAVLDIRQRTGWLFIAVIVGHVVLISAQVNTKRGVPILEAVTFGAFAELQRGTTSAVTSVTEGWQDYFALQQIRKQNEELEQQVAKLQIGLQQERAAAEESRTLQALLQLHSRALVATTGATVIGGGASPDFRTMTIDKGSRDGLKQDMAVIAPAGVVGRIIMPTARASKVQLLIDRNAAAGALVERSRAQGIAVGFGTDRLRLEYVAGSADIKVGDRVVTSGIDGIYPKGFVIGQIESIERGAIELSGITIKPAVEFSALEAVLVVVSPNAAQMEGLPPEPLVPAVVAAGTAPDVPSTAPAAGNPAPPAAAPGAGRAGQPVQPGPAVQPGPGVQPGQPGTPGQPGAGIQQPRTVPQ